MGIDAEVTENNVTGTEENETVGYTGTATPVTGIVQFPQVQTGSSLGSFAPSFSSGFSGGW